MDQKAKRQLIRDGVIILVSLVASYFISQSSLVDTIAHFTGGWYILTTFIAGMFFTSVFTTAPAIAILAKIGAMHNPFVVAVVGGLGAYLGDLLIFKFLKNHLAANIMLLIESRKTGKSKMKALFRQRFFRWSLAFVGAIIIASPFPDELGLALMGLSDIGGKRFAIISFTFNSIGILVIAFIARSAIG